jgi:hypothetical protein
MNKWVSAFLFLVGNGSTICLGQIIETQKLELLIGHVQAYHKGQLVYNHPQFLHIKELPIQIEDTNTILVDSINFLLGVDSLQHEMGIVGNGLTPINGMYWAWQSGYIFVKWEGYVLKESEKESEKENGNEKVMQPFTYHLGGFQYPFRCDQYYSISLKKSLPLNSIRLSFEPTEKLLQFVLESDFEIMSPQPAAVQMMKLFSQCLIVQ